MRNPVMAGADRFKHLLGRGSSKPAGARAGDDKDEDKKSKAEDDDEEDEDKKRDGKKAEDEDDEDKKKRDGKAKGKKAEDEDEEDAKKAENDGEDDEDEEDDKKRDAKAVRKAERARCAAIFAHPSAAARPDFAAHLAFETGMSARSAKAMLASYATPVPAAPAPRERLGQRVAQNPVVGASSDGSADEKKPHERLLAARAATGRK